LQLLQKMLRMAM